MDEAFVTFQNPLAPRSTPPTAAEDFGFLEPCTLGEAKDYCSPFGTI